MAEHDSIATKSPATRSVAPERAIANEGLFHNMFIEDDTIEDTATGYSFTVNVSTKKRLLPLNMGTIKVYRGTLWGKLKPEWQKPYLIEMLRQCGSDLLVDWTLNVEYTKAGNVHVHGYITNTPFSKISLFQDRVHINLGLPRISKDILCKIEATRYNRRKWDEYQTKCKGDTIIM